MKKPNCLLLVLFVLLFFCPTANAQVGRNIQYDQADLKLPNVGWRVGNEVPNVKFKDVYGKEYALHDLSDKITIIDFWFISCKPCIANKKYLKQFYKQYGINILSFSIDERSSTVRRYAEENGMRWINVHDNSVYGDRFLNRIHLSKEGSDGNSYPNYIMIGPDKKIIGFYTSGADIRRLGVDLQNHFKKAIEKQ